MISLILFLAGSFGASDLISWKTVKISLITSPTWCFLCCSRKEREKAQHLGHTQGEGQIHKTASRKPFGRDKHTRTHTQKQGQTESQNHKTVFRQAQIQTHATNRQDSRKHGEGGVENSNLGPFFLRWHPGEMLWFLSLKWHRHTTGKPAWVYSGLPGLLCAGSLSRMFLSLPRGCLLLLHAWPPQQCEGKDLFLLSCSILLLCWELQFARLGLFFF